MKRCFGALLMFLIVGLMATDAEAKRSLPKDVPPVTRDGATYSAPHDQMGCVVAKDEKTGQRLWFKQVYVVKYDVEMEKDVQDCFITELRWDGDKLDISNERGGQFELNVKTLLCKVIKGSEIVERNSDKRR